MSMVDNTVLRSYVAQFSANPNQQTSLDVLRACMHGELPLDITGSDAPTADGWAPGAQLLIRRGTGPGGGPALFAFTNQAEVDRMYPPGTKTMSMVQSAVSVLELARSQGADGLYIDPPDQHARSRRHRSILCCATPETTR